MSLHAAFEQADYVAVVRILREAKTATVVHELLEFLGLVAAEVFNRRLLLLLLDVGVLFSLRPSGKALPRQRTFQEVQDDVTDRLQVIASRLLVTKVSIDRCVAGCASQVLAVAERDVLAIGGLVAFGQSKVNNIDGIFRLVIATNQEIVRLNVAVNDALLMDDLDALDHLDGDMETCLEVKLAAALLEQILERLTK